MTEEVQPPQEDDSRRDPFWSAGSTYYHKASYNRYQTYEVHDVWWNAEVMFGAGGYIYDITFTEYPNSKAQNYSNQIRKNFAEVQLPIHNHIPW